MSSNILTAAILSLVLGAGVACAEESSTIAPESESNLQECEMRISPPSTITYRGPFSRGYDAASSYSHAERATVRILHEGGACQYMLRIEPDTGPGEGHIHSASGHLIYNIEPSGGQGQNADNLVELSGSFSSNQSQKEVPFQISMPIGQRALAGMYSGRVALSLYRTDNGAEELVDQQSVYFASEVAPKVSASFGELASGNNNSIDLDLGTMTRNQKASVDFAVSANTNYKVNFESVNSGALRHELSGLTLDYDIRIDGQLLRDSYPNSATLFTSNENSRHRLDFELRDDATLGVAGKYSDRLSLIISAQ